MTQEDQLQATICQLFDVALAKPAGYFAVPNGGKRNLLTAVNLKRTGVKAGVSDLVVYSPGGRVFFVEIKVPRTGRLSGAQYEFQQAVEAAGHTYVILRSVVEAELFLEVNWLKRTPSKKKPTSKAA